MDGYIAGASGDLIQSVSLAWPQPNTLYIIFYTRLPPTNQPTELQSVSSFDARVRMLFCVLADDTQHKQHTHLTPRRIDASFDSGKTDWALTRHTAEWDGARTLKVVNFRRNIRNVACNDAVRNRRDKRDMCAEMLQKNGQQMRFQRSLLSGCRY